MCIYVHMHIFSHQTGEELSKGIINDDAGTAVAIFERVAYFSLTISIHFIPFDFNHSTGFNDLSVFSLRLCKSDGHLRDSPLTLFGEFRAKCIGCQELIPRFAIRCKLSRQLPWQDGVRRLCFCCGKETRTLIGDDLCRYPRTIHILQDLGKCLSRGLNWTDFPRISQRLTWINGWQLKFATRTNLSFLNSMPSTGWACEV